MGQDQLSGTPQKGKHHRKVELAVPVVRTTTLPTPLHLHVNLKKMQMQKEQQAARDRDNLLHYARLGDIKQSPGRVDNWNFYCKHRTLFLVSCACEWLSSGKEALLSRCLELCRVLRCPLEDNSSDILLKYSLNWEKRRRDLEQIYWENRQLMKRLSEKKSELAQGRWQQDWHKEQLLCNSLARYPRGTRSCQAGTERRRQRTGGGSSPASACGGNPSGSPNRAYFPCSGTRTGLVGERFWGSRNKPALEGQVTPAACPPPILRKKDRTQPSGSNKRTSVSAKDFSTQEADGSSGRPNLPGVASLEKPVVEAVVAPTKLPPSSHLREKVRFSEKEPTTHFEKVRTLNQTH